MLPPQLQSVAEAAPHKRKGSSQEAHEVDDNPPISTKRRKADTSTRKARRAARDRYWNTLSKVWITPRALREFDRRNAAQSLEQRSTLHYELRSCPTLAPESLKKLKRFARRGGPSLVDIQSPSHPRFMNISFIESSSQGQKRSSKSNNTTSTSQSLSSSAYDRNFEQKCIDSGIYLPEEDNEPENWQEIQEILVRSRPSLSPSQFSDGKIKEFRKAERHARNENDVASDSLSTILGPNQRDFPSAKNVLFENIDDIGPDMFKKTKPNLYWGAQPVQIEQQVKQDLSSQFVPSNHNYPVASNFFLKVKSPNGSSAVEIRQACYDGALGARGMHAIQNHGQTEPIYDNNAYTLSATYHKGLLDMYAHHPTQSSHPIRPTDYYMTPLGAWVLSGSNQNFREGVSAFRNARDFATEQRDILISQVNTVSRNQLTDTLSLNAPNKIQSTDMSFNKSDSQDTITSPGRTSVESDTLSVDELIYDCPPERARTKRQKVLSTRENNLFTSIEIDEPRPRRKGLRPRPHPRRDGLRPRPRPLHRGSGAEEATILSKVCVASSKVVPNDEDISETMTVQNDKQDIAERENSA